MSFRMLINTFKVAKFIVRSPCFFVRLRNDIKRERKIYYQLLVIHYFFRRRFPKKPKQKLKFWDLVAKYIPPLEILYDFTRAVRELVLSIRHMIKDTERALKGFRPMVCYLRYFHNAILDASRVVARSYRDDSTKRFYREVTSFYKVMTILIKTLIILRKRGWKSYKFYKSTKKESKFIYKFIKELNKPRNLFKTVKSIILRRKIPEVHLRRRERFKLRLKLSELYGVYHGKNFPAYSYSYRCFQDGDTLYVKRKEDSKYVKKINRQPFIRHRNFPLRNSIHGHLNLKRKLKKNKKTEEEQAPTTSRNTN